MMANTDAFVKSLIDPDILLGQYPGNTFPTTVARQQIVVSGNTYSSDGDCNIYQSNDGLAPMCVSNRASLVVSAGSALSMTLTQPVSASAGQEPVVEPIQYGGNYVLFSHPVTFSNNTARPGYHFEVSTAPLTVTVTTGFGMVGTVQWWHRAGTVYTPDVLYIVASSSQYNLSIPTGSTAFGATITISQANGVPVLFTTAQNPTAALTFGNHASFTQRYTIPDRLAMSLERGRLLGNKVFLKYDGDNFNNGGGLAAAQFPPGTNPSQFPGSTTYAQILASGIPLLHSGHFKDGCVSRFIQPQAADYALSSTPLRFGANGYTVINWRSSSVSPQPYTITCTVNVEFTSHLTFITKVMPAFAEPNMIADALAVSNRIQMISENPLHGWITKLWDKAKSEVGHILTSRGTWLTLADIGVSLLAAA